MLTLTITLTVTLLLNLTLILTLNCYNVFPIARCKLHSSSAGPFLLWPNGCLDQHALGAEVEVDIRPGDVVLVRTPPPEMGTHFSAHVYFGQRLGGSRC